MKKAPAEKIVLNQEKRGEAFVAELLRWNFYDNSRQMPWKGEKDPYKIWLSEVILQQTRVEQGLKYYQNFIETFPDVHALAAAEDTKVFKLWEGLGYYSRCRNLIETARHISQTFSGIFPSAYSDILALKGVGSYTAAAIASFAYNLPYAVLDGNVFRVLSRVFDIETPIDSPKGKETFSALSQSILPNDKAGEYNQAIMDFGAVICKPVPLCEECFFSRQCLAYQRGKQQLLPVKEKKLKIKTRWLNYFIFFHHNEVLVQQRTGKDIWYGLHQFVLIETKKTVSKKELKSMLDKQHGVQDFQVKMEWKQQQQLTHQKICFYFLVIKINTKIKIANYHWVKSSQLETLAFPRTLQQAVQKIITAIRL